MTEALSHLATTRGASLVRDRCLSPVEHIDAALATAEAPRTRINSFVTITADPERLAGRGDALRREVA